MQISLGIFMQAKTIIVVLNQDLPLKNAMQVLAALTSGMGHTVPPFQVPCMAVYLTNTSQRGRKDFSVSLLQAMC